ncbi:torso-like protein isoform X3 [Rhodnius prolixus]
MDDSWRAFTGSWTSKLAARKLGISHSHITQSRSYLLVMIDWYNQQASLNLTEDIITSNLSEQAAKFAEFLSPNETATLNNFITNIGSHYVSSYVIGDGLFQVFVFKENSYRELKVMLKTSHFNVEKMINFFSSVYRNSVGHIMVKSGDFYLTNWIRKTFKKDSFGNNIYPPTLLEIYKQPILLKLIKNRINKQVLMKLNLKLLDNIFIEKPKKDWFRETVDNRLKLYETNIR